MIGEIIHILSMFLHSVYVKKNVSWQNHKYDNKQNNKHFMARILINIIH